MFMVLLLMLLCIDNQKFSVLLVLSFLVTWFISELTQEMEDAIDNVLHTGAATDLVCRTINNNNLVRKDFDTLQGLHWLNDTVSIHKLA